MFEIAYALMDVITIPERQGNKGSHELQTLFRYLSTSPIKDARFLKVLKQREREEGTRYGVPQALGEFSSDSA